MRKNKKEKIQTNFTYDPDLKPFYTSNVNFCDKKILLFDMDEHCNNIILARTSFMTEYYTPKNECLIIPKTIATNLHLDDDSALDAYMKTQENARNKIVRQYGVISIVTLIYIIAVALSLAKVFEFSLLFITIPYAIFYVYAFFINKNKILNKSYKNYIYILSKKYSKEEISTNLDNIIEHVKTLEYMNQKQKLKNINHFSKLKKIIEL